MSRNATLPAVVDTSSVTTSRVRRHSRVSSFEISSGWPNRVRRVTMTILLFVLVPQIAHANNKVVICYGSMVSALIPLAQRMDFYRPAGVEAELYLFPSGKQALEAMFAGKCDLAAAAETPVVHQSLQRTDFRIVAAISSTSGFERIAARADRGIHRAEHLRGRRIAVPEFTTAHYFLDIYLMAHGITPREVKKVYVPAADVAPAFRRGEVDAVAHWEPHIHLLATEFGARVTTFGIPGLHVSPFLLVARQDFVERKRESVERVLRALIRTEVATGKQPAKARELIGDSYSIGQQEAKLIWELNEFGVTLPQTLPFILENAARWNIGLLPPGQRPAVPNFLDLIHVDALLAVKPAAVTLIR